MINTNIKQNLHKQCIKRQKNRQMGLSVYLCIYISSYSVKVFKCFKNLHSTLQDTFVSSRLKDFSLKGGDPAARSDTATLLRLHPSHRPPLRRLPPYG